MPDSSSNGASLGGADAIPQGETPSEALEAQRRKRLELEAAETIEAAQKDKGATTGAVAFVPTGDAQALMVLADDVYQLEHALKTPRRIMGRLRDHTLFQGARHEILAASIFARCGFTVEFINDKTRKMPEFFGSKQRPAEKIAVEVKSQHRPGVLHYPARPNGEQARIELRADVEHLVREALDQNPGGMPFFIIIDLNLPLTPGIPPREKPWFKDLEDIFDRLQTGAGNGPEEVTAVIFTNFGWHYHRDRGLPGNEYVMAPAPNPRYPVSHETWELLKRALDEYGLIPDERDARKGSSCSVPRVQLKSLEETLNELPVYVVAPLSNQWA